jgi:membrane protein YqaA with SNARE-associated domain
MDAALAYLSPIASHFQGLIDFVGSHPHLAVSAVFLLALSEAIPVVGTVVPGSTTIIGISALATTAEINPWLLLVAATAGAIAGDGISFWLGQHYKREILRTWPLNLYPQLIRRSKAFIKRHGITSVFLALHRGRSRLRAVACGRAAHVPPAFLRRQHSIRARVGARACVSGRAACHRGELRRQVGGAPHAARLRCAGSGIDPVGREQIPARTSRDRERTLEPNLSAGLDRNPAKGRRSGRRGDTGVLVDLPEVRPVNRSRARRARMAMGFRDSRPCRDREEPCHDDNRYEDDCEPACFRSHLFPL